MRRSVFKLQSKSKKGQIKELEDLIKYHKKLYYAGNPEINDFQYDYLEAKLRELDENNAVLQLVGSGE